MEKISIRYDIDKNKKKSKDQSEQFLLSLPMSIVYMPPPPHSRPITPSHILSLCLSHIPTRSPFPHTGPGPYFIPTKRGLDCLRIRTDTSPHTPLLLLLGRRQTVGHHPVDQYTPLYATTPTYMYVYLYRSSY